MRNRMNLVFLLLIFSALPLTGQVWKDKPPDQWDARNVGKILIDSPWSKVITTPATWARVGGEKFETATTVGRVDNKTMRDAEGPGATTAGGEYFAHLVLQWGSSKTIRQANLREATLKGRFTRDAERDLGRVPEDYELVLVWDPLILFPIANEVTASVNSYIRPKKSGKEFRPRRVVYHGKLGGKVEKVVFYFPRTDDEGRPVISPGETTVDFLWKIGAGNVQARFDPSKMVARGSSGPDL